MFEKFTELFTEASGSFPFLKLTINFYRARGWRVKVVNHAGGKEELIFDHDNTDKDFLLARAYISLSDYLVEKEYIND